jgi:hypothetical protein
MKSRAVINPAEAAAAGLVALVTASTAGAILMMIAQPKAVAQGAPRAEHDIARIETMLRSPGDPDAYPRGAVCEAWPATVAVTVSQTIQATAKTGGLAVSALTVNPGASSGSGRRLAPVSVQLRATGPYTSVVHFLDALSKTRPMIFLDSVDLKTNITAVELNMNGRFYCSLYALR